jgi:hypothetical protein
VPDEPTLVDLMKPGAKLQRAPMDTAAKAYANVLDRSGTQRRAVFDLLCAAQPTGMTDEELFNASRIVQARTRRKELCEKGFVVDSGRRRLTERGQDAAVWVLSEQAVAILAEMHQ